MSFYRRSDGSLPHGPAPTVAYRGKVAQRDLLLEVVEEDAARAAKAGQTGTRARPVSMRRGPAKAPAFVLDPCLACQKRSATEGSNFCVEHACSETNVDGMRCPNLAADGRRTCKGGYHMSNARIGFLEEARLRREAISTREESQKEMDWRESIEFFTRSFPSVGDPSPSSSTSSLPSSSPPAPPVSAAAAAIPPLPTAPRPIAVPYFPIPPLRIISQPLRR